MNESPIAAGDLMTPAETAEFLKIKPRTLRNLIRRRLLPTIKLTGKIVRFRRSEVEAALGKLAVGCAPRQ